MHTTNNIDFSGFGGYQFAYDFIEHLTKEHGFEKVLQLIKNSSYEDTFGKSEEEIYKTWRSTFAAK